MARLYSAALLSLLSVASARIVTVNRVTTGDGTTITSSETPVVVTNEETKWISTTIFEASTSVTTVPTGVINTESYSSQSNPVKTATLVSSSLTNSIDPDTYSGSYTIVQPTAASATAASETSSAAAESPAVIISGSSSSGTSSASVTTSPEGTSTASSSAASSSATSSTGASAGTASESSTSTALTSTSSASSSSSSSTGSASSSASTSSSSTISTSSTASSTGSSTSATSATSTSGAYSGSIFGAISTEEPPSMFPREDLAITMPANYDSSQICQTNKFYDNLLLAGSNLTSFAQPYGLFYSTEDGYQGLGISYTNASQRVYGPDANADPVEYYLNPTLIKSLVLSAKEFTSDNLEIPEVSAMGPFTVNVTLQTENCWSDQHLVIPYAIGSGFVTGIYNGYTPRLFSEVGISEIVLVNSTDCYSDLIKYQVKLMNGVQWNVYVNSDVEDFEFTAVSDYEVMGNIAPPDGKTVVVQVAVVESNEDTIDKAAGAYPIDASVSGETDSTTTTYRIAYDVVGDSESGTTLLYALPHHVSSFSSVTSPNVISDLTVYSTNKGYLTGVLANTLEMQEDVSDVPDWINGDNTVVSSDALKLLATTVNSELAEDITSQLDQTSTYTSGKAYDKFAYILLAAADVLQNEDTTTEGLERLKSAFAIYAENKQEVNLMYDTLLKGVTSSAANREGGSSMDDFGSPYYNDHHFHYGYMVHCAAVIGYLDKTYGNGTWVSDNKDWVNSLVRDVANPSSEDTYFPVFRMFDFFSGHSWAHGMFAAADGKDEESTSEDYNFAYGMKLWGKVIGDQEMEARGNLMLAIMKRSMLDYFLFLTDNSIEPSKILANKVAGITFENKLDHTTYFGTNLEYIQGIQMIPVTPASVMIRSSEFVEQEWDSLLASIVDDLDSGWKGILRANQALFDADASYEFFSSDDFTSSWLDNGASRSWYLAFSALQGGS